MFGENKSVVIPNISTREMLIQNTIVCTSFFKRIDFDNTEGYNRKMNAGMEDWDFWLSVLKQGGEIYKIPKVLFFYRIRHKSRQRSITNEQYQELKNQLHLNHHDLYFRVFGNPIDLYKKVDIIQRSFLYKIYKRFINLLPNFIFKSF
jgi:GT2 family glycosyltransferase